MIISLEERNIRSEQISIHIDNIKSIYSLVAVNIMIMVSILKQRKCDM